MKDEEMALTMVEAIVVLKTEAILAILRDPKKREKAANITKYSEDQIMAFFMRVMTKKAEAIVVEKVKGIII